MGDQLGPVVQRVDNFIQQINPYPVDKIGAFLILIGQRANFIRWIKLSTLRTTGPMASQEPINRSLYLHQFLESTLSRVALFLERLFSREKNHVQRMNRILWMASVEKVLDHGGM